MKGPKFPVWLEVAFVALCGLTIWLAVRIERKDAPPYRGIVTGKEWTPSQTVLVPMLIGKTTVLMPHKTEEAFYLVVSGRRFEVEREEFDRVQVREEWTERK